MATKAEHVEVVSVLVRARLSGAMPRLYPPDRVATDGAERDTRFRGALCAADAWGVAHRRHAREPQHADASYAPCPLVRPPLGLAELMADCGVCCGVCVCACVLLWDDAMQWPRSSVSPPACAPWSTQRTQALL